MIKITTFQTACKHLSPLETQVIFMGYGYDNYRRVREKYPHVQHLRDEREKQLNLWSLDLINLDATMADLDPLWLASDLAENNICLEDFSLYIFNSLALIKGVLKQNTNILLICDHDEQVFVYSQVLKNNGFNVQSKINYVILSKKVIGLLWHKISISFGSLGKISFLKLARIYNNVPIPFPFLKQARVLFVNWVGPDSFRSDNLLLKDRYFGDLLSHLDKSGVKLSVMGKPLDFVFSFYEISQSSIQVNKNAFFLQDFLSFKDIVISFFKSFLFLKYINHPFKLGGVNFSQVWKWFCFKDSMKGRIPLALETYYASRNVFKELSQSQVTLIYPYENQPWEKLLCLSFYDQFPQGKAFAYQHFPFAKDYLTSYPSQVYLAQNKAPSLLLSDNFFGSWLTEKGCNNHKLVGSFRFQALHQMHKLKTKPAEGRIKNLLCCCSIQLDDSLELVSLVTDILSALDAVTQKSIYLNVNFHPLMGQASKEKIKGLLKGLEFAVNACDLSADELIGNSYLVFYNSNSICFNAAARGIPAIFIKSDLQINLDRISTVSLQVNSPQEGAQIVSMLLHDEKIYDELSLKYRAYFESYYHPPNYDFIQEILTTQELTTPKERKHVSN